MTAEARRASPAGGVAGDHGPQPDADSRRLRRAAAVIDVFVYTVILNLAVQFVPSILTESFTISLLTAVLLKIVLELVVVAKNAAKRRFQAAAGPVRKVGAGLLLWLVLVGSKFAVLELTALVFGDRVALGGFVLVTLLILALLLARTAMRRLLAA